MVAHPSSNGGKSSTMEQTDNGIAYIRHDFGWWFAVLGWVVFTLGHVQVFSFRWRDFGQVVLCIYLAFFTQLITTFAFGERGCVLLGGTVIAFLGSLLARNPTRPACLVLMLRGFFVLTAGALGLRGLTNGAEASAFMRGEETPPSAGRRVSVSSPFPLRGSVFVVQNAQPAPVRACLTLAPSSRFVC